MLQGIEPNLLAPTGLFFSDAVYLSSTQPPATPPPGSVALFARGDGTGGVEVCVGFPDGSVQVLASGR